MLTACALLLGCWQAAAAGAKVYCVAPATGCSDGIQPSLQAALTQVKTDGTAGRIVLGPSLYTSPLAGFVYSGTAPVEVDGVGSNATTVTLPPADNNRYVLNSTSTGALTLSGVRLLLSSSSTGDTGLNVVGPATVANVTVDGSSATTPSDGIILSGGGTVSGTTVTLAPVAQETALQISGSTATTVQDSTFAGVNGILANGPGAVEIHRCVVMGTSSSTNGTALGASGGTVSADDSLVRASGDNATSATALVAVTGTAAAPTIDATQLTIVGNGSDTGVLSEALSSGAATINLTDSIVADPLNASIFVLKAGGGGANVTIDHSDFDPGRADALSGATLTIGSHDVHSYVTPRFANSANDFRLLASSPLLNFDPTALGATPVGATESASDLSGGMRITGSGRDLGAYQHQPPTVTAAAAPASVATGGQASFTAVGAAGTPGDAFSYAWHFDDGTTATGASVTHAFSTQGTHSATATVTDITGLTAAATTTVKVTTPPPPALVPPKTPAPPKPLVAPKITGVSESHANWRPGTKLARIARRHRAPVGTTFSFRLNEPATVRFAFTQRVAGRGMARKCAVQTHRNRHRARCIRTVITAGMMFPGHAGVNRIAFQGRMSNKQTLRPGRYVLIITATSGARRRSSPRSLSFRILKR